MSTKNYYKGYQLYFWLLHKLHKRLTYWIIIFLIEQSIHIKKWLFEDNIVVNKFINLGMWYIMV